MKCTWCTAEATQGGRLPTGARGKEVWPACAAHDNKLDKLGLVRLLPDELAAYARSEKREQKEAARKR